MWLQYYWDPGVQGPMPRLTVIQVAAYFGHANVVKWRLNKGASLEEIDNIRGRTPLLWATCGNHSAIVKLLLDKGANVDCRDLAMARWTPTIACCQGWLQRRRQAAAQKRR